MAREALAFIRTRPGETASFVLNHWTKAIAESAMVLPLRLDGGLTWNDRGDGAYQDLENRLANLRVWEFLWAGRFRGDRILGGAKARGCDPAGRLSGLFIIIVDWPLFRVAL